MDATKAGRFVVDSNGKSVWKSSGQVNSGAGSRGDVLASIQTVGEYTGTLERNDPVPQKPIAAMSFGQRVRISRLWAEHASFIGQTIRIAGWAKNTRASGSAFCFVELNDGSCFKNIQVVID